jgi:hypothetical protein
MTTGLRELPASIQLRLQKRQLDQDKAEQVLKTLTDALVTKRKKFVEGRAACGIEDVWRKIDNNMACIDELTGQGPAIVRPRYTKGVTLTDGIRRNDDAPAGIQGRSTAFERLTARYVAAGAAKVNSIITSIDAKLFSLDATPVPDVAELQAEASPMQINGQPAMRDPKPEELVPPNPTDPLAAPAMPPGMSPDAMPGVPLTTKDLADEAVSIAHQKAKKAEQIIYDWQIEAKYPKHVRKMVLRAARYGTGVMKGPFPELRKMRVVSKPAENRVVMQYKEVLKPAFKALSPWDCFPDPDCGEDIHEGSGFFERDFAAEKTVLGLTKEPGYFGREILQAIKEGPQKREQQNEGPNSQTSPLKDGRFELWYFTGTLTLEEAKAINACLNLPDEHKDIRLPLKAMVPVTVTMVNDRIIKCVHTPLDSGRLPYRFFIWEEREGSCWGIGVGEQCFMPQDMINGALRAMANNAAAGAQIVLNKQLIVPADQSAMVYMLKLWHLSPDATVDDIRKAFGIFDIPNVTDKMIAIIMHAYLVAENSTNIPLISQGHSGKTTPDTYGAAQLQDNNANQLLRDVSNRYDDCVGEPNVEDLYEWLMADPEIDDNAKGDFQISAKGAASMAERYIQDQWLAQEYPMVQDPKFGINPKKWYAQLRRSKHLNPEDVQYTDEEQQKLAQVPPPKPPQVQVAEIRAQVDMEKAKAQHDRDTTYVQAETQRTQNEHMARMKELEQKLQIAMQEAQIKMEQIKADIAETTMKLKVQQTISDDDRTANQVAEAGTEPPGRAPDGKAFER